MSTSIYVHGIRLVEDGSTHEVSSEEFSNVEWPQFYGFYAWLGCDWRNYHMIPPFEKVRQVPRSENHLIEPYDFTPVYAVRVEDLFAFDYDQTFEDRRCGVKTGPQSYNGAATCEEGSGKVVTYREFFGRHYFQCLDKMKELDVTELWYYFD